MPARHEITSKKENHQKEASCVVLEMFLQAKRDLARENGYLKLNTNNNTILNNAVFIILWKTGEVSVTYRSRTQANETMTHCFSLRKDRTDMHDIYYRVYESKKEMKEAKNRMLLLLKKALLPSEIVNKRLG